jgi:hypothetical protein
MLGKEKGHRTGKKWIQIGIKNGDKLIFSKDSRKIAIVQNVEARTVSYEGKIYRLSGLAKILLNTNIEKQGTLFFLYKGENLAKLLGTYHGR